MTGTASSRGRIFSDFDSYKNEEWLRRRKLRLEQVRKQSNDIAKALRMKIINEEKTKAEELNRIKEAELREWKVEKLDEWEQKLKYALEEFGRGHKLAEEEPDPKKVMEIKNKINLLKAYERGEIARQEELKKKKLKEEEETLHIHRKKMTRKMEDLRSALIRSILVQKQLLDLRDDCEEKIEPHIHHQNNEIQDQKGFSNFNKNVPNVINSKKSQGITHKKVLSKKARKKKPVLKKVMGDQLQTNHVKSEVRENCVLRRPETSWVHLDDIQSSSRINTGSSFCSRKTDQSKKTQTEKTEKMVVFYDYPSRYYRKSFIDFPNLVEKINSESEPNANELARIEEESERLETKKKQDANVISQERGLKALKREKITRDYNNLIAKLEDLNKKEKIIKAQQRIPPSLVHLNDERLSERTKTKQKRMESKFENIYYQATSGFSIVESYPEPQPTYDRSAGGDCFASDDRVSTKLSFSRSNLKTNSPVTQTDDSETPSSVVSPSNLRSKKKKKLLSDVDKALREGRELRRTMSRNRENSHEKSSEEISDVVENRNGSACESETSKPITIVESIPSPKAEETEKVIKCHDRESQTEDFMNSDNIDNKETEVKKLHDIDSKTGDDSLPVSTSTSYKSPPSVIGSCIYSRILDYLERQSESEEGVSIKNNVKSKKKIKKLLNDLLHDANYSVLKKNKEESSQTPSLEFYILKLLNMSRECVANLSVSSDNISTPTVTDLDVRNENELDHKYDLGSVSFDEISSKRKELIKEYRLKRAAEWEENIKNWKALLEENLEPEDEPDCTHSNPAEIRQQDEDTIYIKPSETAKFEPIEKNDDLFVYDSPTKSKYDKITKKCSERISQLSSMLDKVRKDKEELINSNSGTSSLSLSRGGKVLEKVFEKEEEEFNKGFREKLCSSMESEDFVIQKSFVNRSNLSQQIEENISTKAVFDSQSCKNESLSSSDSFPDVMDELLKREIITSPFKWSEGENTIEVVTTNENVINPSSIESAIENFRKEMSKIKPFSTNTSHSDSKTKPRCFFSSNENYEEVFSSPKKCNARRMLFSDLPEDLLENEPNSHSNKFCYQEESSVESINHALTSLGLNWAKSFLRKNKQSKAITSSSGSEESKSSEDEDENFYTRRTNKY